MWYSTWFNWRTAHEQYPKKNGEKHSIGKTQINTTDSKYAH